MMVQGATSHNRERLRLGEENKRGRWPDTSAATSERTQRLDKAVLNRMVHSFSSNEMVQDLIRIFTKVERLGPGRISSIQLTKHMNIAVSRTIRYMDHFIHSSKHTLKWAGREKHQSS